MKPDLAAIVAPMKISEIWSVVHPNPNDGGHEQVGPHPAVVIAVHLESELCTVVPLSSQVQDAMNFPHTHLVQRSIINRLNGDSAALIFQVRCVDFMRFRDRIGLLEQTEFNSICKKLRLYLRV